MKMLSVLLFTITFCIVSTGCLYAAVDNGYLFVTFKGEQTSASEQIYFALSKDGRKWTELNGGQPVLTSCLGEKGVRDPFLLRAHDGKTFYLVATDLSIHRNPDWSRAQKAGSQSIVVWESADLVHWSSPRLEHVAAPDAGCAWAPEAVYDEAAGDYLIFWASKNRSDNFAKQRIWAARTADFHTFSKPFIYIEKPSQVIDTDIVREGNKYYRFSKDEQFKAITMEVSDQLMGPWLDVTNFSLAHLQGFEGPECYQIKPSINGKPATWCLILDHYTRGDGYKPFLTDDLTKGQFAAAEEFTLPFPFRHVSVLPIDSAEFDSLQSAFGKTTSPASSAGNNLLITPPTPILDGFTADPSIRLFGDTYYIYPTSDKPNWMTTDFSVWSSKNLVEWRKEGMALDVAHNLKWASVKAWAPDCIERNGMYYFYFCANGQIGVATSTKPTGPFKDALGHPMIQRSDKVKTYPIDPYPFIDDDGKAYLFFGNNSLMVYKLNQDMISVDGDPQTIPLREFREGIVVFKRHGQYYFMWSIDDARSPDYRLGWGVSSNLFGPVKSPDQGFVILQKHGSVVGTGHNSVVNVPGTDRWYVAYHRHAIPNGNGFKRQVCLARLEFDTDDHILPMDPMVQTFRPGDRGEPILDGKGLPDTP